MKNVPEPQLNLISLAAQSLATAAHPMFGNSRSRLARKIRAVRAEIPSPFRLTFSQLYREFREVQP